MTQARRESRVVCRKGRESRKLSVRFARTLFPLLNAILTFSNYSHTISRVSPFSILSIFRTISLHEREWRKLAKWEFLKFIRINTVGGFSRLKTRPRGVASEARRETMEKQRDIRSTRNRDEIRSFSSSSSARKTVSLSLRMLPRRNNTRFAL